VGKYCEMLHNQLSHHDVFNRLDKLKQSLSQDQWTEADRTEYNNLDTTITELILYAESCAGRRISQRFQWSPQLKQVVFKIRYWAYRLRSFQHLPVSDEKLELYKKEANITIDEEVRDWHSVNAAYKAAYQKLRTLQEKQQELRENHLQQLVEAVILERFPELGTDSMATARQSKVEKQIKQLTYREKTRKMYRKIGQVLKKVAG
jgi:hypothetical protein